MNSIEVAEITRLPGKYRPLGAWGYFWYTILFSLPVIGFICLIIFSISDGNINRRSYARSYWVAALVAVVIGIIAGILGAVVMLGLGALGSLGSML